MHSGSNTVMEKNHSLFKLQNLRIPRPSIRYDKEMDETIISVYYDDPEPTTADEFNEELFKDPGPITRKELNIIEKLVNYVYHEKREEYESLASNERKEHIMQDCKAADAWLIQQYAYLDRKEP